MKTLVLSTLLYFPIFLQSQCNYEFFILKKGTKYEYTYYNNKNTVEHTHLTIIENTSQTNDTLIIKTQNVLTNHSGQIITKWIQEYRCYDGILSYDMRSLFDPKMLSEFKHMEIQILSDQLHIPSTLEVGQNLNNGSAIMTVINKDTTIMNTKITVTNRKVESKERIDVPAGKFDCYKITYTVDTKSVFKVQINVVEWFAKGIGIVKQEFYDHGGQITGYKVLTSIKK